MTVASMARIEEENSKRLLANLLREESGRRFFLGNGTTVKEQSKEQSISSQIFPKKQKFKVGLSYGKEKEDSTTTTTTGIKAKMPIGKANVRFGAALIERETKRIEQEAIERNAFEQLSTSAGVNIDDPFGFGGGADLGWRGKSTGGEWNVESPDYTGSGKWNTPYQKQVTGRYGVPIGDGWSLGVEGSTGAMGMSPRYMEGDPNKWENFLAALLKYER
jgi:hypothetical protein